MSSPAGYSGTPLPKKLGIKPHTTVALLDAPDGFERTLGKLPEATRIVRAARGRADRVLLFVLERADLVRRFPTATRVLDGGGGLWIAWPKRASGVPTDLTEDVVRAHGLLNGFVDYKVCAIDATWSGLQFARRKTTPAGRRAAGA